MAISALRTLFYGTGEAGGSPAEYYAKGTSLAVYTSSCISSPSALSLFLLPPRSRPAFKITGLGLKESDLLSLLDHRVNVFKSR